MAIKYQVLPISGLIRLVVEPSWDEPDLFNLNLQVRSQVNVYHSRILTSGDLSYCKQHLRLLEREAALSFKDKAWDEGRLFILRRFWFEVRERQVFVVTLPEYIGQTLPFIQIPRTFSSDEEARLFIEENHTEVERTKEDGL